MRAAVVALAASMVVVSCGASNRSTLPQLTSGVSSAPASSLSSVSSSVATGPASSDTAPAAATDGTPATSAPDSEAAANGDKGFGVYEGTFTSAFPTVAHRVDVPAGGTVSFYVAGADGAPLAVETHIGLDEDAAVAYLVSSQQASDDDDARKWLADHCTQVVPSTEALDHGPGWECDDPSSYDHNPQTIHFKLAGVRTFVFSLVDDNPPTNPQPGDIAYELAHDGVPYRLEVVEGEPPASWPRG